VVRTHVSWQWLALPVLLFALLLVLGGWMIAQRNEAGALGLELASPKAPASLR